MLKQSDARFRAGENSVVDAKRLAEVRTLVPRSAGPGRFVPQFTEISAPRKWNRFAASGLLHIIAIVLLIRMTDVIVRNEVQLAKSTHYETITLIAPSPERPLTPKPVLRAPKIAPQVTVSRQLPEARPMKIETPKAEAPKVNMPPVNPPKAVLATVTPVVPKPPLPERRITQGVFDSGSSAKPTMKAPVQQVQTGGFGDPNGVAGKSDQPRKVTVASVGSFDLPSGAGQGNGSAGNKGIRGTVASAGFGDGVASTGAGDRNPAMRVAVGSFGDAKSTQVETRAETHSPKATPVEILSKPRPVYTDEARKLRIEGEVLLDVMFSASGSVRVLKVVRGLGHGLDDAAQRAAEQIRFQPAKRDGRPYDSNAVVHILFELAD